MSEIWKNEKERIEDFRQYAGDIIKEEKIGVLADMGYFTLPASIGHHGKEEGDLYLHSRTVARLLEEFTRKEHLLWQRPESPKIIGLLHDLCKTEEYEKKNFMGSYYYGRNEGTVLQGHGEISVMIAQNILELTVEEMLCIRYHMGAFEGHHMWNYLQRAADLYPNILWTIQADLTASWILKV